MRFKASPLSTRKYGCDYAFQLGLLGMGNATEQLIRAFDAAEKRRGFVPPFFVDIRLRRSGRAKGFVDKAFEHVVSESRYRWMQDLGNENIASGESGVKIKLARL